MAETWINYTQETTKPKVKNPNKSCDTTLNAQTSKSTWVNVLLSNQLMTEQYADRQYFCQISIDNIAEVPWVYWGLA